MLQDDIPHYQPDNNNTVAVLYILPALTRATDAGLDVAAVLNECDIPIGFLQEPNARISSDQYTQLMMLLMRQFDDEFMLHGGKKRTRLGTFAMMCHAVIHCSTLSKAMARSLQFYNLFLDDIHFRLSKRKDRATLTFSLPSTQTVEDYTTTECTLVIMHRFASWLIDQRIDLLEAHFQYSKPNHVEEYQRLFHCPLKFMQHSNGIVFPIKYLKYPVQQGPDTLNDFLRNTPGNLLRFPDKNNTLTAQIRAIIGTDFRHDFPDFETVAQQLNTTPQTLRRHLKEENTSYQEIKDKLRRDAAIYYLRRPNLSINDITELMGFSEPSTFHRAFKKWTGVTPGVYRQENQEHFDG